MRYVLIDRIERLEIDRQIVAIKNVALSEDVFSEHFVGCPIMPGALLIESLAQAGTALLEVSLDSRKAVHSKVSVSVTKKALLVMVIRAKFRSLVRPGDQLRVSAKLISRGNDLAETDGIIHVGDRLVADARLVFALQDAENFYPGNVRQIVEAGYNVLLQDATIIDPSGDANE